MTKITNLSSMTQTKKQQFKCLLLVKVFFIGKKTSRFYTGQITRWFDTTL